MGKDLDFLPMLDEPHSDDRLPEAARQFEIFLDAVSQEAARSEKSFLFDRRYLPLLSGEELEVVDRTPFWFEDLSPGQQAWASSPHP